MSRLRRFLAKWLIIDLKKRNRWSYLKILVLEGLFILFLYPTLNFMSPLWDWRYFLIAYVVSWPLWLLVLWLDEKEEGERS